MAPYQVFTSQNYPYLQKHSGVPGTEIATLKRAFFVEPLGVDGGLNPWYSLLGKIILMADFCVRSSRSIYVYPH